MSCDFAHDDGAYVLGSLSPTERQQFEQHLSECTDCAESVRQFAGLPGLLARVPMDVLELPTSEEPVPDTLLPSLVREVRHAQHRRRFLLVGTAAAAALLTALVSVVGARALWGGDAAPTAAGPGVTSGASVNHPMTALGQEAVHARVGFESVAWGTRLDLSCRYAPSGARYAEPHTATYSLVIRTRSGRSEQVATWRAVPGRTMQITAATAVPRSRIAAVEVRSADGAPVLQWSGT